MLRDELPYFGVHFFFCAPTNSIYALQLQCKMNFNPISWAMS